MYFDNTWLTWALLLAILFFFLATFVTLLFLYLAAESVREDRKLRRKLERQFEKPAHYGIAVINEARRAAGYTKLEPRARWISKDWWTHKCSENNTRWTNQYEVSPECPMCGVERPESGYEGVNYENE